ncbi:MAG: ATP-binding protein [Euryarchaeota archaeon]|nr:ATP-binding protein [Euryarchaeota archaeon]
MEERHRALLVKQNPWWSDKKVKLPDFERDLINTLVRYVEYKQILAVIGLRRVGKTVLMKQLMQKLTTPKNNLCYISLDDIDFQNYNIVEELINYFLEFSDKNGMRYLFLDEVQKLPNWADLLKTYYDTEDNLKIFVTGSASLELSEFKETLAGRILTFHMPVLKFREFARYFMPDDTLKNISISSLSSIFGSSLSKDSFIREYDIEFAGKKERYNELFKSYLLKGAFPELLDIEDEEFIKKYIKESVIEKTIVDIARLAGEDEKIIYELFRLLANSNAQLFEITNLSGILKINRNLVSKYVNLLEKSFLINVAYNFTSSVARQVRASKKQYSAHSSIVIAMLDHPFDILNTEVAGHMVEAAISGDFEKTSFWRTPQKDEVDIILKEKGIVLPIEVKYQQNITNSDAASVLKFCKKFGVRNGLMVTKELMDMRKIGDVEMLFIPAWLFLLINP